MTTTSLVATVALAVLAGGTARAAESPAPDPPPGIEELSWLAGHWRGEGLGGSCEEVWASPLGGTMMGSFRLVKDGAVSFYELMVLDRDEEGMALKVKHFSREFSAWEEKDEAVAFRLESVEPNRAVFEGLVLERTGDRLEVRLRMRSKTGETRWETLAMRAYVP